MFKPSRMSASLTTAWSRSPSWTLPAIASQRHAASSQPHALLLEQDTLRQHAADGCPGADSPLGVDHPLPRHPLGAVAHRHAHHARAPRPAEPRRDLSVRRDPPPGDLHDEPPHAALEFVHGLTSPNCSSYSLA